MALGRSGDKYIVNIIQKVKLLFQVKGYVEEDLKGAKAMNGTKPGWKTTEFWLTVANQVAMVWGSVSGFVPPKYAIIASAVGTCAYTILRTLAKG